MGSCGSVKPFPEEPNARVTVLMRFQRILICGVPLVPRSLGHCCAWVAIAAALLSLPLVFPVVLLVVSDDMSRGVLAPVWMRGTWAHPMLWLFVLVGTPLVYTVLVLCFCRRKRRTD
jgi:hypothetical protein